MSGANSDLSPPIVGSGCVRRDLALLFLKLGLTAFGGPAAHIAMMEDEVVRHRGWLSGAEFLDLLGATNLIPGPNSTEMAIHIGRRMAGKAGLLIAGTCFIAPAALVTLVAAWAYVGYGALPRVQGALYGIKPVIIAVVALALWRLGATAVKTPALFAVAVGAMAADLLAMNQVAIILAAGVVMLAARARWTGAAGAIVPMLAIAPRATAAALSNVAAPFSLGALFLFFAKVGAI
ncbi:MAG: chromate transporter, partial [Candidatus Binataceae bacterium]